MRSIIRNARGVVRRNSFRLFNLDGWYPMRRERNLIRNLLRIVCGAAVFAVATVPLAAQGRDVRGGRLVLDDDGADGTVNTMMVETPNPLPINTTLLIPDPGTAVASFLLSESSTPQTVNADILFTGTINMTGATLLGVSVSTNSTLTGDGSVGSPVGLALGNANVWTAPQSFSAINASGTITGAALTDGTATLSGGSLDLGPGTDDDLSAADVAGLTGGGSTALHNHDGRYYTEAELGSTLNGLGASLIGVEDAGGNFTATDIEGVLAELAAGSGGGAGTTEPFITASASGSLAAERVLTGGTGVSIVDGGANSTMTVGIGQDVAPTAAPTFAGLTIPTGNLTITTGNIAVTTGNVSTTVGNISTSAGDISTSDGDIRIGNGGELRLTEPGGANYTGFRAQAQAGNVTYTLPAADGSSGQVLTTDGAGALSWTAPGSPSGFGTVGGLGFAYKTSDEDVTSNTTLQNDDDLSISLNANEIYEVYGVLYVTTTNNGHNLKLALTTPTGASMKVAYNSVRSAGTSTRESDVLVSSGVSETDVSLNSGDVVIVFLKGIIRTAGNSGNLVFQWADTNGGGGHTVTVQTDSFLKVTRVQ